jgi:hypothetical protein
MPSGSESMIGDCGHAEEHAIWQAIHHKWEVEDAELWVLGVNKPDNVLLAGTKFYCVRCSTLMRYARIAGVHIYSAVQWHFVPTEEAYNTSLEYALKK